MNAYSGVCRGSRGSAMFLWIALAVSAILISINSSLYAGDVSLAWSGTTLNEDGSTLTDLAGYRLYYGLASRSYSSDIDVGDVTTAVVPGLDDGRIYYFAVTAYSSKGREGAFSSEATWASPDITPPSISCPDSVTITADLSGTASMPDL
jgi:hypothetical protein